MGENFKNLGHGWLGWLGWAGWAGLAGLAGLAGWLAGWLVELAWSYIVFSFSQSIIIIL